jgi:glyoxylase-like metal-dependent hydrolase (beta-lactamase superfamily II)
MAHGRPTVHTVEVPVPFRLAIVNCYLIVAETLALVDVGPNHEPSLEELERGIADTGYRLEDVELLLITHQHYDHVGAARAIVERSGARVAAHRLLVPFLADLDAAMEAEDAYAVDLMALHGVEPETVEYLRSRSRSDHRYGSSITVDLPLADGEAIDLGGMTLRALYRPGHSPSDTVFVDESAAEAFGGDHLLPQISSNPIVHRPLEGEADIRRRRPVLPVYLESLRLTAERDLTKVLPGHGPPVDDHRALIVKRLGEHDARKERIYAAVETPKTARELTYSLWANLARDQVYLGVSEVLGHLDLLEGEGRVVLDEEGGVVRYARAS